MCNWVQLGTDPFCTFCQNEQKGSVPNCTFLAEGDVQDHHQGETQGKADGADVGVIAFGGFRD